MMMMWSPSTQSCAMWLEAITRQWRPMVVSWPSWVARWMVTYSRTTVSSPRLTPTGVPSRNLRSWGTPPMIAPCPIRQRAPTRTRPSSTAWAPISAPAATVTSGPITEYGPTRASAASSAPRSTTAVGWITTGAPPAREDGSRPALLQLAQALLEGADPLDQLGKLALPRPDALLLGGRSARNAAPHFPGRDVVGHAGLGGQDGARPDRHVVGHADLTGQHGPVAHPRRARDAQLGDQDHVLAHVAVVPDLHQVVDLGAAAHDRLAQGRAVDRGVGPDLDVVLDAQAAHLRDLAMGLSVEGVAEAVGTQHRSGVDDDPVADAHVLADHDVGMQAHVLAEHRAAPHERERPHAAARPDDRFRLHHRERADGRGAVDAGSPGHAGGRVHPGLGPRLGMEEPEQHDQRLLGVVDPEQRGGEVGDVARHQQGAGPARLGLLEVLAIGEEGHLIRARDVERRHPAYHPAGVTLERRPERVGESAERERDVVAHLLRGLLGLVVVGLEDVVGEVSVRGGVEYPGALPLDHHREALLFPQALDEAGYVLEHLLEEGVLFLLELGLEIVHQAAYVPDLALERILLLAPGVRGEELALLLQLVAHLLQLHLLPVELALHARLVLLELLAGRRSCDRAGEDPLDVHDRDPPVRRRGGSGRLSLGVGPHRADARQERQGRRGPPPCHPLPHVLPPQLERGAGGEVEVAEALALLLVEFDPVVDADGAEGRVPSEARSHPVPQVAEVDLGSQGEVRSPHLPYIVEDRGLDPEEKRDLVLDGAQELAVAADPGAGVVLGGDLERLELPQRVRATQVEALEERHRVLAPAEGITRHQPEAQDVIEPRQGLEVGAREDAAGKLLPEADAREVHPERDGVAPGRVVDAVAGVAGEAQPDQGREMGPLLGDELGAAKRIDVGDSILADPVDCVPARVLPEGVPEPDIATQGVDRVVGQDAAGVEDVEAGGEWLVEEPGLGEADGAGLEVLATPQAEEHLPALAEKVPLRQVEGAEDAVLGAVAASDREEPGGLLGDVDVDDDLVLGGPGGGFGLDLVEVVEIGQLLLRAGELLAREEVPLRHRELPPEDLLLAAGVARDVDPLHVGFGTLVDLEDDVDQPARGVLEGVGAHVGGGAADRAVEVGDPLDAVAELGPGEDVARLQLDPLPDLLHREHRVAHHVHAADLELRPLDHHDPDGGAGLFAVDLDLRRLHPSLYVAVVVVELDDPVHVLVESLPLDGSPQDDILALLGVHRPLHLLGGEPLGALDHDLVDADPPTLRDSVGHGDVPVGELLGLGGDADLEVAILLVVLLELVGALVNLHRVVDASQLELDLLLQGGRVLLLVPGEDDVADERPLHHHVGQLDAPLEVLDLHLHVVEEAETEDGPDILGGAVGDEGTADLGADPAEDHRLLHPAVALDRDLLDEDLPVSGGGSLRQGRERS